MPKNRSHVFGVQVSRQHFAGVYAEETRLFRRDLVRNSFYAVAVRISTRLRHDIFYCHNFIAVHRDRPSATFLSLTRL